MRIRRFLLFAILVLSATLPAWAQVKFSTTINEKEIGKDDYIQVEFSIENASSVESLTPPAFTGFTVVSGPMQQTGISIVNGATTKSEGISYVLKPNAIGKFTIGGATAVIDGKQMHSNPVAITVTNAPSKQQSGGGGGGGINPFFGFSMPEEVPEVNEEYILRKDENAADKIKNNLFARLDVNKTTCYAGEPVVATYRLFSRVKSESRVTKRPTLSQFSVYDMVQPEANNPTIEKINGKPYNVHIIRKVQLYPLQDGSFVLDPVELDNTVRFLRLQGSNRVSMQQMLDDYMNGVTDGKMEEQKITIASKPVTITVKPLPAAGKPDSFDGAVGKFSISATIPKMKIEAGETAELDVVLKGQGNLTLINAPQVNWPESVEGYDATVKENLDKTVAPISGAKMFQFTFTPNKEGDITIPAIVFSYFDPAANAYKTITTEAITTHIDKATKSHKATSTATAAKTPQNESSWLGNKLLLWLLPLLLIIAFVVYRIAKKKPQTKRPPIISPENTKPETIEPVAPTDPFEAAKFALAAVNSQLFYKETGKAVWNILSEKFNLTSSQLNKPVVVRLLQQENASAEKIGLLENVLNDCELALYTPVHTEHDMRETLDKAERLKQLLA
ncbi:MAG: BatD family protein [Chitinophagaceae bacterium]